MTEFARITYADVPRNDDPIRSWFECPCGVSNPDLLWRCDREGRSVPAHLSAGFVVCTSCGRIMTIDGAVIGTKPLFDQEGIA